MVARDAAAGGSATERRDAMGPADTAAGGRGCAGGGECLGDSQCSGGGCVRVDSLPVNATIHAKYATIHAVPGGHHGDSQCSGGACVGGSGHSGSGSGGGGGRGGCSNKKRETIIHLILVIHNFVNTSLLL